MQILLIYNFYKFRKKNSKYFYKLLNFSRIKADNEMGEEFLSRIERIT